MPDRNLKLDTIEYLIVQGMFRHYGVEDLENFLPLYSQVANPDLIETAFLNLRRKIDALEGT